MLKHEVGLDIDSIFEAPEPLSPEALHLAGLDATELKAFFFRQIPVAVIFAVGSPFRWVWGQLLSLRFRGPPKVPFTLEQKTFVFEDEAREELNDALSPIYYQLNKHTHWKIVGWIPCKSSFPLNQPTTKGS